MFVTPGYAQEAAPAEGEAHTPAEGQSTEAGAHEAAAGAHTEVPGEGHGSGSFPPFDPTYYPSQILWLAITFGLFYLFLQKVILPRIGGILQVRSDRIAQDLQQAGRMKEEADAAVAAYEQALAEAKGNANTIGQQARDKARADADAQRKRIEADLESKLGKAEANIASIKAKAMGEVGTIAEDAATAIIRELIGGAADKAAVAAAVKAAKS
jgi:F-type H+-transporting ATPase subunit b